MQKKSLIIDGHNFLYRGYYGVPEAATLPNGFQINAIYGFFSLLRNTVKNLEPENLLIVFDSETGIQKKLEAFPEYKSNREYKETNIFEQLEIIKKIIKEIGICMTESPDHEADDLIGTFANNFTKTKDNKTFIASNDFDFMQIVNQNINIVRGIHNNIDIFDEEIILKRFGVSPKQYIHYHALKGDNSDNLSGIKGIGFKTARKLISDYESLENLYDNLQNLSPRHQKLLDGHKERIIRLRDFIKINTEINPIPDLSKENLDFEKEKLFGKIRGLIEKVV